MPMTCAEDITASDKMQAERIVNVLEKATHVLNRDWVSGVVQDSIAGLEAEFFEGVESVQIAKLRGLVKDGTHAELVAIFFLLLNIDARLKTRMLEIDSGNARRIGRFLLDLRQELVVEFFCSPQSVAEFVRACEDGYRIA